MVTDSGSFPGFGFGSPSFGGPTATDTNGTPANGAGKPNIFGPQQAPATAPGAAKPGNPAQIGNALTNGAAVGTNNQPTDANAVLGTETAGTGKKIVQDTYANAGLQITKNIPGSVNDSRPDEQKPIRTQQGFATDPATGKPVDVTISHQGGNTVEVRKGEDSSSIVQKNADGTIQAMGKIEKKDGMTLGSSIVHGNNGSTTETQVKYDPSGNLVREKQQTKDAAGNVTSTTQKAANYDTNGNLQREVTQTDTADGHTVKTAKVASKDGNGGFDVVKKDDQGNEIRQKLDKDGNVTATFNKETGKYEEAKGDKVKSGSLEDIQQQKKQIEDGVAKKLQAGNDETSKKYQDLDAQASKLDPKDPNYEQKKKDLDSQKQGIVAEEAGKSSSLYKQLSNDEAVKKGDGKGTALLDSAVKKATSDKPTTNAGSKMNKFLTDQAISISASTQAMAQKFAMAHGGLSANSGRMKVRRHH